MSSFEHLIDLGLLNILPLENKFEKAPRESHLLLQNWDSDFFLRSDNGTIFA
jgi:hypothetical protein